MNSYDILDTDIEKVVAVKELPPLDVRKQQIEYLIEYFWKVTGRKPKSYQLERMADYILADTLRDKATHKVKQTEYPVLSFTQMKLRNRRERRVGDENLDFIKVKEVDNNPNSFKVKTRNKEEA
ncbi:hypothetical protein ABEX38_30085 [Priestia megaterium]